MKKSPNHHKPYVLGFSFEKFKKDLETITLLESPNVRVSDLVNEETSSKRVLHETINLIEIARGLGADYAAEAAVIPVRNVKGKFVVGNMLVTRDEITKPENTKFKNMNRLASVDQNEGLY